MITLFDVSRRSVINICSIYIIRRLKITHISYKIHVRIIILEQVSIREVRSIGSLVMHCILTDICSISRVRIVRIDIIVTIVTHVVSNQVRCEFHIVVIVHIECIEITLVRSSCIAKDLVTVNLPRRVIPNLNSIEVIT